MYSEKRVQLFALNFVLSSLLIMRHHNKIVCYLRMDVKCIIAVVFLHQRLSKEVLDFLVTRQQYLAQGEMMLLKYKKNH